jgi:hypothetical protein
MSSRRSAYVIKHKETYLLTIILRNMSSFFMGLLLTLVLQNRQPDNKNHLVHSILRHCRTLIHVQH